MDNVDRVVGHDGKKSLFPFYFFPSRCLLEGSMSFKVMPFSFHFPAPKECLWAVTFHVKYLKCATHHSELRGKSNMLCASLLLTHSGGWAHLTSQVTTGDALLVCDTTKESLLHPLCSKSSSTFERHWSKPQDLEGRQGLGNVTGFS